MSPDQAVRDIERVRRFLRCAHLLDQDERDGIAAANVVQQFQKQV